MECIRYKDGYKYQLNAEYRQQINILPETDVDTPYIRLTTSGELTIAKGYAWDGPSGPTIDTKNFMRGSLVHDALYQLMRGNYLDKEKCKQPADRLLQQMCKQDGMSAIRAWWVYQGLKIGGGAAADSDNAKQLIHAPKGCPK